MIGNVEYIDIHNGIQVGSIVLFVLILIFFLVLRIRGESPESIYRLTRRMWNKIVENMGRTRKPEDTETYLLGDRIQRPDEEDIDVFSDFPEN